MNIKSSWVLLLSLGILSGCSATKLADIPQTRENYNKAIENSENEQFLLNIVRMHYGRSPYFVNLDSITTQSTLRTRVEGQFFSSPMSVMGTPFWNISPTVEFTEAPTITYTPLQGTKYISGMMTPLTIQHLGLLLGSGWDLPTVFKLTINRIGVLDNSDVSKHVVAGSSAHNHEFYHYIEVLNNLIHSNQLDSSITSYRDKPAILLQANNQQAGQQISQLLHLKKTYTQFIFSRYAIASPETPENIINLQTRSLLGIMNYLSYGVNTLENNPLNANKNPLSGNFDVKISDSNPNNAAVKVNYDNLWYYIDNNDGNSKARIVLLKLIYSLQLGDIKSNLPMVTIPVSH